MLFVTINLHYLGRLNDRALISAIGLANITLNCIGVALVIGLNMGMGSMVGRAYGAQSMELERNYFSKGVVSFLLMFVVIALILVNAEGILLAVGQHPDVSRLCEHYIVGILPAVFCQLLFDLLRNLLCAQGIFAPSLYLIIAGLAFHTALCASLVTTYGLDGVIWTMNLSSCVMLCGKIAYMLRDTRQRMFLRRDVFTAQTFSHFALYAQETMYIALPLFIDFFVFEINALLVGNLQRLEQFSAHVILSNYIGSFFSFPAGVSGTITYLTSTACGANRPQRARNLNNFGLVIVIAFGTLITLCNLIFAPSIASFYTRDAEVAHNVVLVLRSYSFILVVDYVQMMQSGVMKGVGLGKLNLLYFVIGFYLVGLPCSVTLMFGFDWGLVGIWGGVMVGISVVACLIWRAIANLNWQL